MQYSLSKLWRKVLQCGVRARDRERNALNLITSASISEIDFVIPLKSGENPGGEDESGAHSGSHGENGEELSGYVHNLHICRVRPSKNSVCTQST